MEITLNLEPAEAYALRDLARRLLSRDIERTMDNVHRAKLADEARNKLSFAIHCALGEPCAACGGSEEDHQSNYYCPEYRAPKND